MIDKKRILVLSNACFSKTDSNGRTLASLLDGIDRENLAQFFVYGTPDFEVCSRFYRVSDGDAFRSFLKQRPFGGVVSSAVEETPINRTKKAKVKKTPTAMLLRETAWLLGRWNSDCLNQWIDSFAPDVILVSLADNGFLPDLARKVAKRKNIPVCVYSTENYIFKNYNYITRRPSLFYSLFYGWLNLTYRRLEPYVKQGIFNSPMLAETYRGRYCYPCHCIFNHSEIDFIPKFRVGDPPRVAYLGNLGVGRHMPLIEIANTLADMIPGTKLNIYGKLPEDLAAEKALLECPDIHYCGFVPYRDVIQVIHESDLLVHAEQEDPFWSKDLKYAFSTKIADSVCSGTPLLMYARADLAGTDFLIRRNCAFVARSTSELRKVLVSALTDETARRNVLMAAEETRKECFSNRGQLEELLWLHD